MTDQSRPTDEPAAPLHPLVIRFGRARVFRPVAPRMWPQQSPCFRYVEVPESEANVRQSPIVTWEEFEAAKKDAG